MHSRFGELCYAVLAGTSYAPANNLHLTTLLPLEDYTFEMFTALHAQNQGGFLRWPLEIDVKN